MRKMSDRHVPSRVILQDDSIYCRDVPVSMPSGETGLSGCGWCFCGAVSDDVLPHVSMTHCHLFGLNALQHLAARNIGVSVDEKLNGKIHCNVPRRLLLDGSSPAVELATITCSYGIPSSVECLDLAASCLQRISGNYFINRKLPCVVSMCRCHMSTRNMWTEHTAGCDTISGKKCSRKRHECDLSAVSEVESARDDNSCSNLDTQQQLRQRRHVSSHSTRSLSKQLMDGSSVSAAGTSDSHSVKSSNSPADKKVYASVHSERSKLESPVVVSPRHCDNSSILSYSHTTSARSTRSTTAANRDKSLSCDTVSLTEKIVTAANAHKSLTKHKGQQLQKVIANKKQTRYSTLHRRVKSLSCDTDNLTEMLCKTVTTDAHKLLTKDEGQQLLKVIVKKKRTRQSTLRSSQSSRKLRSRMSSSSLLTENKRLQSTDNDSARVKTRHRCSNVSVQNAGNTTRAGITADCEVLVPRLAVHGSCTRQTRKNGCTRYQRVCDVAPVSVNNAAVPLRCALNRAMTGNMSSSAAESTVVSLINDLQDNSCSAKPENINSIASEGQRKSDELSKLTALSVDINFSCDEICSSPASPLPPISLKMTESQHCNSVLQSAALLTTRRSAVYSHLSTNL